MNESILEIEELRRAYEAASLGSASLDEAMERGYASDDEENRRLVATDTAAMKEAEASFLETIRRHRREGDGVVEGWATLHLEACLQMFRDADRAVGEEKTVRSICVAEVLEGVASVLGSSPRPFTINACHLDDYDDVYDRLASRS